MLQISALGWAPTGITPPVQTRTRGVTARDDLRLMEAIKAGDASAIEAFYDRHSGLVLALCRRILGDSPEADEASLDSFVQIGYRTLVLT